MGVSSMLKKIGLTDRDLQCGVGDPIDKPITAVCNECSGVHAGMLATAVFNGEDISTYMDKNHPVQERVKQAVLDLTCMSTEEVLTPIDGCGIPTYCMPLHHIAWAFARLTAVDSIPGQHRDAVDRVVRAYRSHPAMVTGQATYSTRVMREFGGRLLLKEGSQGVFGMSDLESGIGVAIKVEDGRKDELPPVLNELLHQLDIGINGPLDILNNQANTELENTNKDVVGEFKAEFKLIKS